MERVKALINKLQEQASQNADASTLLATIQLLQLELSKPVNGRPQQLGTAKVAVVMPTNNRFAPVPMEAAAAISQQVSTESKRTHEKVYQPTEKREDENGWLFDPMKEIPTLAHQQHSRELNDVIGHKGASLNDKLKTEKTELSEVLTDTPKAIGINDRYVFLNELFRGDETMYERSIKTINGFRILPEAEYWIDRELKVKLGWDDGKTITQHFYQLVKRRFS